MTIKRKLEVIIEFQSSCSEADLCSHADNILVAIKHAIKEIPNHSWNQRVSVSWDESFKVNTHVEIK